MKHNKYIVFLQERESGLYEVVLESNNLNDVKTYLMNTISDYLITELITIEDNKHENT